MNWNRAVEEISPKLYRYFSASFRPEMASDLVQEVFIRLVKKYDDGGFDPKRGSLLVFAYGIARNVRLEAWKAVTPEDSYADPKDFDFRRVVSSHEPSAEEMRLAQLRSAIMSLSEIQRQIILLHLDDELTLSQISEILAVPLNTVKSHIHRAKELLKEILVKEERGATYE
jgi:RNA polymerase sigma-70 factor (ECF subfamily)